MAYMFECPYLHASVELTDERDRHIAERHPDLLPEHRERIADTLRDPDQVRRSARAPTARTFSRWFSDLDNGKHVVVVIILGGDPGGRNWVVTAYVARRLAGGDIEWIRS
jgi:hypothetical protein